jgi:hypothetical protein
MSEELLFTEAEWNAAAPKVVAAMTDYLRPYRTAIYDLTQKDGTGWGSGSYLRLLDSVFILTNEHVADDMNPKRTGEFLGHQFDGQEAIRRVVGDRPVYPWPLDLALLPVSKNAWEENANKSKATELGQIAVGHDPAPTEILTFTGFAGQNVSFYFDTLFAQGVCYTARQTELPTDDRFSSRFHFGIDYRPAAATAVMGSKELPLPPGLSGSTVWDTGFVRAKMTGIQWTPEFARVTGVVWGWPEGSRFLVATRAEYVRSFLLAAIAPSLPDR